MDRSGASELSVVLQGVHRLLPWKRGPQPTRQAGDHNWDLERLIQYVILPAKRLYSYQPGQAVHGAEENAQMRDRIRGFIDSFERLRKLHEETPPK